ncbi:MAG: prepilin-type N-terminal cleavage/methylation domain-containing protein [Motiliproteus sp.]
MKPLTAPSKHAGFTLIELIVVIVLLGIMSFGMTQFIVNSALGYADTARRERLGSTSRVVIARISQELRGALPGSVRSDNGHCIEFIPQVGASHYEDLPTATALTSFTSIPMEVPGLPVAGPFYAAVDPGSLAQVYTGGALSRGAIEQRYADLLVVEPRTAVKVATVSFATAETFSGRSPRQRWFLLKAPVSFCVSGDKLFRYQAVWPGAQLDQGYAQPTPAELPDSIATGRTLLARNVGGGFEVEKIAVPRHTRVRIDLSFYEPGNSGVVERVGIEHEVQLRELP